MATASTDAVTEVAPLMPQKNAVGASGRIAATFMPSGNGMPISRPIGARSRTAVAMRSGCRLAAERIDDGRRSDTKRHDDDKQRNDRPELFASHADVATYADEPVGDERADAAEQQEREQHD